MVEESDRMLASRQQQRKGRSRRHVRQGGVMAEFRILSLDGGGAWALIEVMTLIDLYGADTRGHEVLKQFDLIAGTSGGSIVLGGLAKDMTLRELLDLFLDRKRRE